MNINLEDSSFRKSWKGETSEKVGRNLDGMVLDIFHMLNVQRAKHDRYSHCVIILTLPVFLSS